MEIDQDPVVLANGVLNVKLHPLVILNISEHWVREKMIKESTSIKVFGALLGKQDGSHLEVLTSIEVLCDESQMTLDTEFFNTRQSQCKQVHPDLDFIGCYTTGSGIGDEDKIFNANVQDLFESLIMLKCDPLERNGEHLPIRIYESAVDNEGRFNFKLVNYELAHNEVERIGVDHIARVNATMADDNTSLTAENLLGSYHAIKMLSDRLRIITSYVAAVKAGELAPNQARLREISAIVHRLPLLLKRGGDRVGGQSSAFASDAQGDSRRQLYRQANDVCLSTLLGCVTQGLHVAQSTLTKTLHLLDKRPTHMGAAGSTWAHFGKRMPPKVRQP